MADRVPWWKAFTGRVLSSILGDVAVQQDHPCENKNLDESQFNSAVANNNFSRNLTVSHSGRFREKRKVRGNLPSSGNFYESGIAVAK